MRQSASLVCYMLEIFGCNSDKRQKEHFLVKLYCENTIKTTCIYTVGIQIAALMSFSIVAAIKGQGWF